MEEKGCPCYTRMEVSWWIEGERGPSAPPKQCMQLYIGKEPIKTHMSTCFEFNVRIVILLSIRNSGQDHFFINTKSHDDAMIEKNFTLLSLNMLHPLSRKSKAKDILENLDIVATWWSQVLPYEQRWREVMSKKGQQTQEQDHETMEILYAKWQVTPHNYGASPV
jgi:hypothetical protein